MARRRNKGLGFTGVLLVIGLLYFTGAGAWLWQRLERFGSDCYAMMATTGVGQTRLLCDGASRIIVWVGDLPEQFHRGVDGLKARFGFQAALPDTAGIQDEVSRRLAALGSSGEAWKQRLQAGPSSLWQGDARSQLQQAMDHFTIANQYFSHGSTSEAVAWLRNGASAPSGYGVMSQWQLGNIYSQGGGGITADSGKARLYYEQARQSLRQLESSSAPEAQQLLSSLPFTKAELDARLK